MQIDPQNTSLMLEFSTSGDTILENCISYKIKRIELQSSIWNWKRTNFECFKMSYIGSKTCKVCTIWNVFWDFALLFLTLLNHPLNFFISSSLQIFKELLELKYVWSMCEGEMMFNLFCGGNSFQQWWSTPRLPRSIPKMQISNKKEKTFYLTLNYLEEKLFISFSIKLKIFYFYS